MVFSSFNFLFWFFTSLMVLYFLIPQQFRGARNLLLLLYSLFFYAYGGPPFLLLMLVSIAVNYAGGLLAVPGAKHRKLWLTAAICANLGLLGWFKYANFFAETLNSLGFSLASPGVVLPIGISFFTFQGMSYVLDVSRGDALPERNPLRVALYVALFPQLVAGPIVRYTTVADEIRSRRESVADYTDGSIRFLFGLAKKLVLANGTGILADEIFGIPADGLTVTLAWIGAVSYTFQIYFDFSAYSDMAIGLGRMFGFHFLENFNYPYIARSVSDFWSRWHISLGSWFRDYVYIPLGGNRCGIGRHILNIFVVWFLTGLWHGAAWTFVGWGLFYFVLLVGERYLWGKYLPKLGAFSHVYTMIAVIFGMVIFRADSLHYAGQMILAMLGAVPLNDRRTTYYLLEYGSIFLPALLGCLPLKTILRERLSRSKKPAAQIVLIWFPRLAALALLGLSYVLLLTSTFNPFIYFRF